MFKTGIDFCVLVCLLLYFIELIVNCALYVIFFSLFPVLIRYLGSCTCQTSALQLMYLPKFVCGFFKVFYIQCHL